MASRCRRVNSTRERSRMRGRPSSGRRPVADGGAGGEGMARAITSSTIVVAIVKATKERRSGTPTLGFVPRTPPIHHA
jgi:hypothetical protein